MIHYLKTEPRFFEAVLCGDKKFEIRFNDDRGFQKGDIVWLQRINERGSGLTGDEIEVVITYVTNFMQRDGFVVFGFKEIDRRLIK